MVTLVDADHRPRRLNIPEECRIQMGSSKPLFLGSGRYSKSSESSSGNTSLKVGISWTTGTLDPCFFKMLVAASTSGLRSCVTKVCWLPVLLIRWATPAAEFLGETAKATHSARMIPSFVVPYVRTSRRQGIGASKKELAERNGKLFTRVGQHRDHRLLAADLRFRKLENAADIAPSTMDRTYPCGEIGLPELSGSVFIDVHEVFWAVGTVEIDDLCCNQTEIKRRRDEGSAVEGLSGRRGRDPLRHCTCDVGGAVALPIQDVVLYSCLPETRSAGSQTPSRTESEWRIRPREHCTLTVGSFHPL